MKESKYRLRQRMKIKEDEYKNSNEYMDSCLIKAIEDYDFWEDVLSFIEKGANPELKTEDNLSIWTGLEKIFTCWAEDTADHWNGSTGEWDTEYERNNLKYIQQQIERTMTKYPNVDIDGLCYSGTFLNVVCIEARRVQDISLFNDIIKTLLDHGADPCRKDYINRPIDWFSGREIPADSPLYIYQIEQQKKQLEKIVIEEDKKIVTKRI